MHNQGDVLLIPIPFSDLSSVKKRPVLVLSNDNYNKVTDDIIVVAITSNVGTKFSEVKLSNTDIIVGELKVESSIRVDKIYTISQNIAIKKLATVKPDIVIEVKNKLMELI